MQRTGSALSPEGTEMKAKMWKNTFYQNSFFSKIPPPKKAQQSKLTLPDQL